MSAISGIVRFDGGAVSPRDMERMERALQHLGPDGRRVTLSGPVGLGHCLTVVNQEDHFESQPLYDSERDLTLVAMRVSTTAKSLRKHWASACPCAR